MLTKTRAQFMPSAESTVREHIFTHLIQPGEWRLCGRCTYAPQATKDGAAASSTQGGQATVDSAELFCEECRASLPRALFLDPSKTEVVELYKYENEYESL